MKTCRGGAFIDNFDLQRKLFAAWHKFARGKMRRRAVCAFWLSLEQNLTQVYHELLTREYRHGRYHHFVMHDTKRRDIYVAPIRDRVVHQLVATELERIYAPLFYTYSCAAQKGKGVSYARGHVFNVIRRQQGRWRLWIAHLDVKRCYASIPHAQLCAVFARRVSDPLLMRLCFEIIKSFGTNDRGLPLGNVTSQWFANIYLNELDWFVKHTIKVPWYMRYNDDMIMLSHDRASLERTVVRICDFIGQHLSLTIPPHKRMIKCLPAPIDVLGVCTNGVKQWTRTVTRRHAEKRLYDPCFLFSDSVYERLAAYHRFGVAHALDVFDSFY